MNTDDFVKVLVESEKGLTADEKSKLIEGVDTIYIDSRLNHHKRLAQRQLASFVLLVIFALFTLGVIIYASYASEYTSGLLKGVTAGYIVALFVLFPKTFKNHSRIAFVIKVIKQICSSKWVCNW